MKVRRVFISALMIILFFSCKSSGKAQENIECENCNCIDSLTLKSTNIYSKLIPLQKKSTADITMSFLEDKTKLVDSLSKTDYHFILDNIEIINSISFDDLTPVIPKQICSSENLNLLTDDTNSRNKIYVPLGFSESNAVIISEEEIKAKNIEDIKNEDDGLPNYYDGVFYKHKQFKNYYIYIYYEGRPFEPGDQWELKRYTHIIRYDLNGWLKAAVVKMERIDSYTNKKQTLGSDIYFLKSSEEKGAYNIPKKYDSWSFDFTLSDDYNEIGTIEIEGVSWLFSIE